MGIGRNAWQAPQLLLLNEDEYKQRMFSSMTIINDAINTLPEEWLEHYDLNSIQNEIVVVLNQFQQSNFWEDIR